MGTSSIEDQTVYSLGEHDFVRLFGCDQRTRHVLRQVLEHDFVGYDFLYRVASESERDAFLFDICQKIFSEGTAVAGEHRHADWERGWSENYEGFVGSDFDLDLLSPKYYRDFMPMRLEQKFIVPLKKDFFRQYSEVFRCWILRTYFSECATVCEFGCGTAINLVALATVYPEKKYYGYDWAQASVDILSLLKKQYGWDMTGGCFDFYNVSNDIATVTGAGVFTFTALEQLGEDYKSFVDMLLRCGPSIVVNVEPINEFCYKDNFLDYLSLQYHRKRKYLWDYYSYLRELENSGKIEIINATEHKGGNIYHYSTSYIVWKLVG